MGKEIMLGGDKYYSPNPNKKSGEPPTLNPGDVKKNLEYLETVKAEKSLYANRFNHKFLEDGVPVIFNGTSMLDGLMKKIKPGDIVDIVYVGYNECPFGANKGKKSHEFKMYYSEDKVTEDGEESDTPETPDTEAF